MFATRHLMMASVPLALAMVLSITESASAQRRGGGGSRGGSSGGRGYKGGSVSAYRGGARVNYSRNPGWNGGNRGGWNGAYRGSNAWRGNNWNGAWQGNNWNSGWGGFGLGLGIGLLTDQLRPGVWIGNANNFPGYYSYYGDDGYAGDNVFYGLPSTNNSSAFASNGMEDNSREGALADNQANTQSDDRAYVRVRLPDANARIWIEDEEAKDSGLVRDYRSPPLIRDRNYTYEVRAEWNENGQTRKQTRKFPVHSGDHVVVVFGNRAPRQDRDRAAIIPDSIKDEPKTTGPRGGPTGGPASDSGRLGKDAPSQDGSVSPVSPGDRPSGNRPAEDGPDGNGKNEKSPNGESKPPQSKSPQDR